MSVKRPDLFLLVGDALLFKGEDQTDEGNLNQAVAELQQKMRRWSQSYHRKIILLLCICQKLGATAKILVLSLTETVSLALQVGLELK